MRRRGLVKSIGLIVVSLFAIAAIGYALLQPAIGWPSEDRRVVHPAGFSVVAPKGWEQHLLFSDGVGRNDALQFLPTDAVGNPGVFSVTRFATPPTEADLRRQHFEPATFDGNAAWVATKDLPKIYSHARTLIFDRGGAWYEIHLSRPTGEALDTGIWLAYLESFRVEKPRAGTTTLPVLALPVSTQPTS